MYFKGSNLGSVRASAFHSLTALTGLHTLDLSGMVPFCMTRRCCVYMLLLGAIALCLFLTRVAGNVLGGYLQTPAVSIIGKSLVAMTGLQILIFSGKALMQICTCNSCFLGVSNAGTGNRLCEADAAAFGESLTALVGLHTLNLSGTDRCISIASFYLFTFLICTTANRMSERCGTAVSRSLVALTALRALDLSRAAPCTFCVRHLGIMSLFLIHFREFRHFTASHDFVTDWSCCRSSSTNSCSIADGAYWIADATIMP